MNNTIRIATYNLRYANNKDTGNLWNARAAAVAGLIRFHDFDILATQEGLLMQLTELNRSLPYFEKFGAGRDDGKQGGEHSAILFKKDLFTLKEGGNFWLSENPGGPGLGWDGRHNRICSWVQLETREGAQLFVFNVHFDYYGTKAREESSDLMLQEISRIAPGKPCILAGDFNSDRSEKPYKTLAGSSTIRDAYTLARQSYVSSPSFNSWGQASGENRHIDHIFVSKHFQVLNYAVLTDTYQPEPGPDSVSGMKTPSDHFPVMADLILEENA